MRIIIDRIENNIAVCELDDRTIKNIPLSNFSFIPQEGDVCFIEGNEIRFDYYQTKSRKDKLEKMIKDLWQ